MSTETLALHFTFPRGAGREPWHAICVPCHYKTFLAREAGAAQISRQGRLTPLCLSSKLSDILGYGGTDQALAM